MSSGYENKILDYLRNYRHVARKVKEIVSSIDPEARVFVFGSVVKGEYTASSDIDILIVSEKQDLKYDIMVRVYKEVEAPVELHVVSPEQFSSWYLRFIEENEMQEVG